MEPDAASIDPNDLLIFARVAELGSLSRAAERLALPKSTVSRRLSSLETQLGERLLLRTTRRQSLTEFGQLLLEHARLVADEVAAVAALREFRRATPSGRLRVSMPADVANLMLAETLAAFSAMYPEVMLDIDLSARRIDLLGEGYDLALRFGDLPSDNLLAARRLCAVRNGLYASVDYVREHGLPAAPEDLVRHRAVRLLGRQGDALPWTLQRDGQAWQGLPPGRITANSPELLVRLARAGAGIAAVPALLAQPDVASGRLRAVLPDWSLPDEAAWAVFPGRKLMPAKTRAFIDMLQTALARS